MFIELAPGGLISVGTSYTDQRLLWIGIIRLALGIFALFTIIRGIRGYFGYLTHDGSEELKEIAFADLKDSATFLVLAVVGSAVTPFAVNALMNLAGGNGPSFTF
jgi:hypothetical protein